MTGNLFAGKLFVLKVADATLQEEAKKLIQAHKGSLQKNVTERVSMVIVPEQAGEDEPALKKLKKQRPKIKFVKINYLQECIDAGELKNEEEYEMFKGKHIFL